jgi:haloalkane dehalogenase
VSAEVPSDWTFGGLWPYEPRWFETPDGRMHYVDEGPRDGRPVVLVHGNPTWGFLYRNFVGPLADAGYRAIVPDHLGFGRSDKPADPELYRIPRHIERLDSLLESLDLHDAVVVPQDWGGPIGLSWAVAHPERVGGLFILNTYAHGPRGKVKLPVPLRLFRTPGVGELLVKGLHLFVRGFLFRVGVVHRERLTPDVRRAYLTPHPSWSSRTSVLVFPREIPASGSGAVAELTARLERGLEEHFSAKPARIIWAMRDPAFTPAMLDQLWRKTLPQAAVTKIEDAGHYLQEDAHERIVPELLSFLGGEGA